MGNSTKLDLRSIDFEKLHRVFLSSIEYYCLSYYASPTGYDTNNISVILHSFGIEIAKVHDDRIDFAEVLVDLKILQKVHNPYQSLYQVLPMSQQK